MMKYKRITDASHYMLWDQYSNEHGLVPPAGEDGIVIIDGVRSDLSQVQFDDMVPEEAKLPRLRHRPDGTSDAPVGRWRITIEFEPEEPKP